MKKLLLIAAFVAFSAQAETMTVQASGFGDTCEQALTAAKRSALDKVNGAWVHSVERVSNGKHGEEIFQYSGGVIKSYKYLRDDCTYVIIEAEVVKQSNKVQSASADVDRLNQAKYANQQYDYMGQMGTLATAAQSPQHQARAQFMNSLKEACHICKGTDGSGAVMRARPSASSSLLTVLLLPQPTSRSFAT